MTTTSEPLEVRWRAGFKQWHAYFVAPDAPGIATIACRWTRVRYDEWHFWRNVPEYAKLPLCTRCRINVTKHIVEET